MSGLSSCLNIVREFAAAVLSCVRGRATMTPSQIRYMKLKSAQLKKFIEAKKLG